MGARRGRHGERIFSTGGLGSSMTRGAHAAEAGRGGKRDEESGETKAVKGNPSALRSKGCVSSVVPSGTCREEDGIDNAEWERYLIAGRRATDGLREQHSA